MENFLGNYFGNFDHVYALLKRHWLDANADKIEAKQSTGSKIHQDVAL